MAYQRQNWQATDSGILRKKEENEEELLVFGYSCKLFRDDEKALYVDQGKHLIPWMGDESLRIDRYDVRGALYDVSQFEAISGQQEELFWVSLSNEERRIEQLCDEERYRALTHNEDEERLYQEEELKRLHLALGSDKTYGQVSYSYDEENGETEKPAPENVTEDEEPFVPPVELDLPQDIIVPETVKSNAIIEKTALFINQQGSQMEIILKMKQATNPQFEFLSYRSPLHAYYRHVLGALKTGRYKPKILSANNADNNTEGENDSNNQNYYLHHTLSQVPTTSVDVAPVIPSINYKPSSDCAYSMLVNKIRNNQNKMGLLSQINLESEKSTEPVMTMKEDSNPDIVSSPKLYNPLEAVDDANSMDNDVRDLKPSSPIVPLQRSNRRKRRKRQQGACAYNDVADTDSLDGTEMLQPFEQETMNEFAESVDASEEQHEIPPTELQLIIDKMACYVGKNGRDFEEIVKGKGDPRFSFLDVTNPFHVYYRKKVEFFEQSQKPVDDSKVDTIKEGHVNSNGSEKDNDGEDSVHVSQLSDGSSSRASTTSKPNPVCFSIKRPKETENLEIKSALPIEESSDEDNEENEDGKVCTNENVVSGDSVSAEQQVESTNLTPKSSSARHSGQEKRVEEKVKENLSTKDKEKLLQLERKKRAAAFLNLLQKTKKVTSENPETVMIGPQLPDKLDSTSGNEDDVNDDSESLLSPPSSVTSPDVNQQEESLANSVTSPKVRKLLSPKHMKVKRAKYSTPEKYAMPRHHAKVKNDVEYKHKHRKRKRSRTPTRKHYPHSSRSHRHRSEKESKHHRHHRKEYRHDDREYNNSEVVHRRHKHYKLKKHKRKDDKKYDSSKSISSSDSDSN